MLYECYIWDYKNGNEQLIKGAIESLNWEKSFEDDQVYLFNKIILNIFHDFITNKIIKCNYKVRLWFHHEIRQILNKKNKLLK